MLNLEQERGGRFEDLSLVPGAFRARKRPVPVAVSFAQTAGILDTREGLVQYQAGDALLTGIQQERWPVQRDRFMKTYEPLPPTRVGEPGQYVKHPLTVWCLRVNSAVGVSLSANRGQLHAAPNDVIVQYQLGDLAVVGGSIFDASYEVLD